MKAKCDVVAGPDDHGVGWQHKPPTPSRQHMEQLMATLVTLMH